MRTALLAAVLTVSGVYSGSLQASSDLDRSKLKTGILPSGGFYRIYAVGCEDGNTGSVANVEGQRRWCVSRADTLECVRSAQEASQLACKSLSLAKTGQQSEKPVL